MANVIFFVMLFNSYSFKMQNFYLFQKCPSQINSDFRVPKLFRNKLIPFFEAQEELSVHSNCDWL